MKVSYLDHMKKLSVYTAERPSKLESDVSARYFYAKKYCKGKTVLDVGTGFGLGALFLAQNGAKRVLGVDYNSAVIEKNKLIKQKNLDFRTLDALKLDLIEERFDVILAFEIIEHIPVKQVDFFIRLLTFLLKENGVLIVTTPNRGRSEYLWGKPYNPYHIKEYTGSELKDFFMRYFKKVEVKGMRCIDDKFLKTKTSLEKKFRQKIFYLLGHFRVVRELLAYIPKGMKRRVTREEILPTIDYRSFRLFDKWQEGTGLFLVAKKSLPGKIKPKVSVIIANYNGGKYLPSCLKSVLKTKYPNFEILVCDDGSNDDSVETIKKFQRISKKIILLQNKFNLGASASRNKAIKKAEGDIVVFLDNDTEVDRLWLDQLVSTFLEDESVGAAQALLIDYKNRDLVQTGGGVLIPQVAWLIPFYQWKSYRKMRKTLKQTEIVGVSAALAVKRKVLSIVGNFDEKEAVTTEDLDFCWRIWIAGFKIVLVPESKVYHYTKSISDRGNLNVDFRKIYFHLAKNSFRSIIKNYELLNILKYLFTSIFINYSRAFLVLIRRGNASAIIGTTQAVVWNIANFVDTWKERSKIQKTRVFADKSLEGRIFTCESIFDIYSLYFKQTKLLW